MIYIPDEDNEELTRQPTITTHEIQLDRVRLTLIAEIGSFKTVLDKKEKNIMVVDPAHGVSIGGPFCQEKRETDLLIKTYRK